MPLIRGLDHLGELLADFGVYYHEHRCHRRLGGATPSMLYQGQPWQKPDRFVKRLAGPLRLRHFAEPRITVYELAAWPIERGEPALAECPLQRSYECPTPTCGTRSRLTLTSSEPGSAWGRGTATRGRGSSAVQCSPRGKTSRGRGVDLPQRGRRCMVVAQEFPPQVAAIGKAGLVCNGCHRLIGRHEHVYGATQPAP